MCLFDRFCNLSCSRSMWNFIGIAVLMSQWFCSNRFIDILPRFPSAPKKNSDRAAAAHTHHNANGNTCKCLIHFKQLNQLKLICFIHSVGRNAKTGKIKFYDGLVCVCHDTNAIWFGIWWNLYIYVIWAVWCSHSAAHSLVVLCMCVCVWGDHANVFARLTVRLDFMRVFTIYWRYSIIQMKHEMRKRLSIFFICFELILRIYSGDEANAMSCH